MYTKRLSIPSIEYEKDEIRAIKSVLGCDVEIKNFNKVNVIDSSDRIWVNVEYDMIDIDPLRVFKVENPKKLNLNSDKYTVEIDGKLVKLGSLDAQKGKFWVRLYSCKQETENNDIKINYFGEGVDQSTIFSSMCTIFGSKVLSYHGTTIKPKFEDKKFSEVCDKYKVNIETDTKAWRQFRSVSSNAYVDAYYDITYFKTSDINKLNVVAKVCDAKKYEVCVIDVGDYTPKLLSKELETLKTGIIVITNERSSPYSIIYINNDDYELSKYMIEHLIVVLTWDTSNAAEVEF